jgi:hypothetical protein
VLESSTSVRLTYFMPPLNLIPLIFLRPLRLVLPSQDARAIRIVVLKATHAPFVVVIWVYERCVQMWNSAASALAPQGPHISGTPLPSHTALFGARTATKSKMYRPDRAGASRHASSPSDPQPSSTNVNSAELTALVQSLSAKIDDLAAMIAGQQTA